MIPWEKIESSPEYKAVEPAGQKYLKARWFDENISPTQEFNSLSPEEQNTVLLGFFKEDAPDIISEFEQRALDSERSKNLEDMSFATRALFRGWNQTQALLGGATGMIGSLTGIEPLKDWGYKEYVSQTKEAEKYPGATWSDIKDAPWYAVPLKSAQWAVEKGIENLPNMALTLGTSGAGAIMAGSGKVLGSRIAEKAIETVFKNQVAKEVAKGYALKVAEKRVLQNFAAKSAVVASSGALEAGGQYGEQTERGVDKPLTSLALGTAAGFVELMGGNIRIVDRFLGRESSDRKSVV